MEAGGNDHQDTGSVVDGRNDHDWPEDIANYIVEGNWNCAIHRLSVFKRFVSRFKIMRNRLYYVTVTGWPREEAIKRFH